MQSLRRSLQNKTSNGGLNRSAAGLAPPRKVIKALYDYNSSQPEELSFQKGDFYHVIGNEDDEDWYEACNPITGARGFVPVAYFQVLEKSQRNSGGNSGDENNVLTDSHYQHYQQQQQQQQHHHQEPHGSNGGSHYHHQQQQQQQQQHSYHQQPPYGSPASSKVSTPGAGPATSGASSPSLPRCPPLYGIVLYDFGAERADELDAKAGDAILVIAQSNEEWFVAKPIGRLGGPGLIPASFIEIRDMATNKPIDVQEYLRKTGTAIPRVDEWKKQTLDYKNNSIPLGRLEAAEAAQQQHQQKPQQQLPPHQEQPTHHSSAQYSQPHIPVNQYPGNQQMHPQQFQQLHQQQPQGQTLQQLKNKMSRDLKGSAPARDPALRRLPSQEDIHRRTPVREETSGSRTPNASYSASGRMEDNSLDSGYGQEHHQQPHPNQVVQATVESFHHEDDQYWYSVRVELASGAVRHLYRLYEDFYDFHIALLEEFPVESGRVGDQPRILPYMPIPLSVVTDSVSASRRADLDEYVKSLAKMPSRIIQHPLVEQLFALKEGDTETPPSASGSGSTRDRDRDTTSSTASVSSPAMGRERAASSASRASPSGGPRAVYQSRSQGPGSFRSYTDDPPSANGSPSLRSQSTFPSSTSGGTGGAALGSLGGGSGASEENIKLKISFQDDIMAMRIPVSVSFRSLQQKIFERLRTDHKELSYRDERGDFAPIRSDGDWREAVDRSGGKLMVYVD